MLELKKIIKDYGDANSSVRALKGISINFRQCEFTSILGPSGCGKTTLLNIIGGLDRYTSGDLIINGISTRDFTDEYWDAYRNSEIGFVFQSYNLIPHLSVLANVELALKLSGFTRQECREKAVAALTKVHLQEHIHKKPHQLSGGQMQRVSIARALVNDPKIILADEPTGALDSELGEQIMEVLKEVAEERLVIMVTHNDDLAFRYSTRIINIKDGEIVGDSNPYLPEHPYKETVFTGKKRPRLPSLKKSESKGTAPFKHTKMKWSTAMGISWRNLLSKKRRTILTSIAGSIGIIGMGLVLALSNGINLFMENMKSDLLGSVPIGVYEYSMNYDVMTDLFKEFSAANEITGSFPTEEEAYLSNGATNASAILDIMTTLTSSISSNEITPEFVEYLDKMDKNDYVAMNKYYATQMNMITKHEEGGETVYTDVTPSGKISTLFTLAGNVLGSSSLEYDFWNQLIEKDYMSKYYDVVYGKYPTSKEEIVLVINENNEVPIKAFEALGLDYDAIERTVEKDGQIRTALNFSDICNYEIKLLSNDKYYSCNGTDTGWRMTCDSNRQTDEEYQTSLASLYNDESALTLKVVGVLRIKEGAPTTMVQCNFCYTPELGEYVMEQAAQSEIAQAQKRLLADGSTKNVFSETMEEDIVGGDTNWAVTIVSLINNGKNLSAFNRLLGADSTPMYVNIYASTYEGKVKITDYLDKWNEQGGKVKYFDVSEMFIYNVETLTNIATMALLAVAAISLLVSSIMIAIITSNSVVERTREIGILRSIGAKRTDILAVFMAETVLIGLFSGLLGISLTYAIAPGISTIIYDNIGYANLAVVSGAATGGLLALSVLISVLSGFIPSMVAAHKNVVDALRSD